GRAVARGEAGRELGPAGERVAATPAGLHGPPMRGPGRTGAQGPGTRGGDVVGFLLGRGLAPLHGHRDAGEILDGDARAAEVVGVLVPEVPEVAEVLQGVDEPAALGDAGELGLGCGVASQGPAPAR